MFLETLLQYVDGLGLRASDRTLILDYPMDDFVAKNEQY